MIPRRERVREEDLSFLPFFPSDSFFFLFLSFLPGSLPFVVSIQMTPWRELTRSCLSEPSVDTNVLCYSSARLLSPRHASLQRALSGSAAGQEVSGGARSIDVLAVRLGSNCFYRIELPPDVHTCSYCYFLCNGSNFARVFFHNKTPTRPTKRRNKS